MNNELHLDELLDETLHSNSSAAEKVEWLKQNNVSNPEKELELHETAAALVQRYAILQQVTKVHQSFLSENNSSDSAESKIKVVRLQTYKWIFRAVAASILFAGIWFAYEYGSTSTTQLYGNLYQPYGLIVDRADAAQNIQSGLVQAFKDKNFLQVINIYSQLSATSVREKFLAAISYMETGDNLKSVKLLQEILLFNQQTQSRLYNDEAEFYLALNHLKLKAIDQALPLFEKIHKDSNHTFHSRVNSGTLRRVRWLK